MQKPDFNFPIHLSIKRFLPKNEQQTETTDVYTFCDVGSLEVNQQHIDSIFEVCNEPIISKWLFSSNSDSPDKYPGEKAKEFLAWAKDGQAKGTHFVFLVTTKNSQVVACFDIKSNNTDLAEIGYWVSAGHSGLATNGVKHLIEIANEAGYKKLFAQTKDGNQRSVNVLTRNGFILDQSYLANPNCASAFVLDLFY